MSKNRRANVEIRTNFLGEHPRAAQAGASRDGSHGIDKYTPAQGRLRVLLALAFFNFDETNGDLAPSRFGPSKLTAHAPIISPRPKRLVLYCRTPDDVALHLISTRQNYDYGLPGLRLENVRGSDTYVTQHCPTGAELIITGNHNGRWPQENSSRELWHDFLLPGQPLSARECERLNEIPEITDAAERLIAGLFCRSAARSGGDWTLGNWSAYSDFDPLCRPRYEFGRGWNFKERYLWGSRDNWLLEWHGFPFEDDVAEALCGSAIGIARASRIRTAESTVVRLDGARLTLRGPR